MMDGSIGTAMMRNSRSIRVRLGQALLVASVLVALAPGMAQAAATGVAGASDPFEGLNRAFFGVHQFLDRVLIRPAAIGYKRIVPGPVRRGLGNAISNLGEPAIFVNDILQGHGKKAGRTLARFAGNTTVGLAGLIDVATPAGLAHHPNDFGITLAHYGFKAGPYIFVPVVGPTTMRDAIGGAAGLVLNPLVYARYPGDAAVGATSVVAGGLQTRADADGELAALEASATDTYASFRSYFLQNREAEVTGGKLDVKTLPDFGDQPTEPPPTPAPQPSASPQP